MQIERHDVESSGSTRLYLEDAAPYTTILSIQIGSVAHGDVVQVYGEAHGNPLQNNQIENAWVTGISVVDSVGNVVAIPCFYRGQDLEKKPQESRCQGWNMGTRRAARRCANRISDARGKQIQRRLFRGSEGKTWLPRFPSVACRLINRGDSLWRFTT